MARHTYACTQSYEGKIVVKDWGEDDDVLFLDDDLYEPLAERLEWMHHKEVTISYWITGIRITKDEAQESFMRKVIGDAEVFYDVHYSDYTGFLWADEELRIGGHDLLQELQFRKDQYLILQIDYVRTD